MIEEVFLNLHKIFFFHFFVVKFIDLPNIGLIIFVILNKFKNYFNKKKHLKFFIVKKITFRSKTINILIIECINVY